MLEFATPFEAVYFFLCAGACRLCYNPLMRDLALIYVRKSVVRTGRETSPARQLAACQAYCESRGWRHEVYQDAEGHRSGRTEKHRPEWRRLRQQLGRPDVVAVVVNSLDRSSRSPSDFFRFLDDLQRAGVDLVSVTEQFDTTTAIGRAFLAILMVVASLEADMASERVAATIAYRKTEGQTWGLAPFGMARSKADGMCLRSNEDAPAAVECCKQFLRSGSLLATARALNGAGLRFRARPAKRGEQGPLVPWTRDSVRSVLANLLAYCGYSGNGHAKDLAPAGSLAELVAQAGAVATHPAILDEETADQVLALRVATRPAPKRGNRVFALQAVLHCASCGRRLRGSMHRGAPVYRHYSGEACGVVELVPADQVESAVVDLFAGVQLPAELRDELRRVVLERANQDNGRAGIVDQLARLRGKTDRAKALFLEGDIERSEYEALRAESAGRVAELEAQLQPGGYDVDQIAARLEDLAGVVRLATPAQLRAVVLAAFDRLDVGVGGVIEKAEAAEWLRPLLADVWHLVPPREFESLSQP